MIQMKTFLDKTSTVNAMATHGGKKKAWLSTQDKEASRRNSGAGSLGESANKYLVKNNALTEHGLKGLEKKDLSKS